MPHTTNTILIATESDPVAAAVSTAFGAGSEGLASQVDKLDSELGIATRKLDKVARETSDEFASATKSFKSDLSTTTPRMLKIT